MRCCVPHPYAAPSFVNEWPPAVMDSWLPRKKEVMVTLKGHVRSMAPPSDTMYDVLFKAMESPLDWEVKCHVWKLLMSLPSSSAVMTSTKDAQHCVLLPSQGFVSADAYVPTWKGLYALQCIAAHVSSKDSVTGTLTASPTWRAQFLNDGPFGTIMRIFVAVVPRADAVEVDGPEVVVCREGIISTVLSILLNCVHEVSA